MISLYPYSISFKTHSVPLSLSYFHYLPLSSVVLNPSLLPKAMLCPSSPTFHSFLLLFCFITFMSFNLPVRYSSFVPNSSTLPYSFSFSFLQLLSFPLFDQNFCSLQQHSWIYFFLLPLSPFFPSFTHSLFIL